MTKLEISLICIIVAWFVVCIGFGVVIGYISNLINKWKEH